MRFILRILVGKNYYYLKTLKLDRTELLELLTFAEAQDHKSQFKKYTSIAGKRDGNEIMAAYVPLKELAVVKRLSSLFVLESYPLMLRHLPNVAVDKHIDDQNKRNSVVFFPIAPIIDFSPTLFWDLAADEEPCEVVSYPNMCPCLINTQKIHSVYNQSLQTRYSLQICFDENFSVVKKLAENGELFRGKT